MTRDELIGKLKEIALEDEFECGHAEADDLLVEYIGDAEITAAYQAIGKWYA